MGGGSLSGPKPGTILGIDIDFIDGGKGALFKKIIQPPRDKQGYPIDTGNGDRTSKPYTSARELAEYVCECAIKAGMPEGKPKEEE